MLATTTQTLLLCFAVALGIGKFNLNISERVLVEYI